MRQGKIRVLSMLVRMSSCSACMKAFVVSTSHRQHLSWRLSTQCHLTNNRTWSASFSFFRDSVVTALPAQTCRVASVEEKDIAQSVFADRFASLTRCPGTGHSHEHVRRTHRSVLSQLGARTASQLHSLTFVFYVNPL